MARTVRVEGLRALQRDFKRMSRDLDKDLTAELKDVAEPVRGAAEQLALGRISHMTQGWSIMRVGVSRARGSVYIAPKPRRSAGGTPRPNLARLLLERSMEPAVDQKEASVVTGLERMLDRLADRYGF
jgi:hypothetical protein